MEWPVVFHAKTPALSVRSDPVYVEPIITMIQKIAADRRYESEYFKDKSLLTLWCALVAIQIKMDDTYGSLYSVTCTYV